MKNKEKGLWDINKKRETLSHFSLSRCVRDSNPWPHAWQACILTNWTNAPFIFLGLWDINKKRETLSHFSLSRCVRDSNPWPHAWQACILTNWTNAPFIFFVCYLSRLRCKGTAFSEICKHFTNFFSKKSIIFFCSLIYIDQHIQLFHL